MRTGIGTLCFYEIAAIVTDPYRLGDVTLHDVAVPAEAGDGTRQDIVQRGTRRQYLLQSTDERGVLAVARELQHHVTCSLLGVASRLFGMHRQDWRSLGGEEALELHGTDTGGVCRCPHDFGNIESAIFHRQFGSYEVAHNRPTLLGNDLLQRSYEMFVHQSLSPYMSEYYVPDSITSAKQRHIGRRVLNASGALLLEARTSRRLEGDSCTALCGWLCC